MKRPKTKPFLLLLLGFCISLGISYGQSTPLQKTTPLRGKALSKATQKLFDSRHNGSESASRFDNAVVRSEWEYNRVKDPKTGRIPTNILELEQQFSQGIEVNRSFRRATKAQGKSAKGSAMEYWKNRGPFNVGGRTRALAIDRSNENVILAGGVSGGLWRSENGGNSWQKVTTNQQSHSITYIIQDPRQGHENVWYYTSGEIINNSAGYIENDERFIGATYFGSGIYKSVDGARTFTLLESTNDDDITQASPFDLVNSITMNPKTGAIYVATHMGIYKSADAGATFTAVLSNNSRLQNTEIHSTQDGVLYAAIAANNDTSGIYTSVDGEQWTQLNPEIFVNNTGDRFVRAIIASHTSSKEVYVFATYDDGFRSVNNKLIRYRSSETEGQKWTDLSANLPRAIDTQTGYNMVLRVHPNDPNLVFVGGVSLHRSSTAFTKNDAQLIGGANFRKNRGSTSNAISVRLYTNHHADQHALVFYPSDPFRALSGNDGGVYQTDDITDSEIKRVNETVDWTPLNNGFLTTQAYHVAMDLETSSTDLMAGFQDSGSWFTNSSNKEDPWVHDLGGDGGYNAITESGKIRYMSSQGGRIYRLQFDENGEYLNFSIVAGSSSPFFSNGQFITPFSIDPNHINSLYYPNLQGNLIRARRLNKRRTGNNDGLRNDEYEVSVWKAPIDETITALDVSKYPVRHRVYIGTNIGKIMRIDQANTDTPEIIDVSENKGLPNGGYINDITVDPSNSDRVLAIFSNYGIPSVFLTNDAGETWIDISGNLEENVDGSGNGPSVRCAGFLGSGENRRTQRRQTLFVGTSTGLYTNSNVRTGTTRWKKEEFAIGNVVIDELSIRKDGFVAVATHGRGIFTARYPIVDSLPSFNSTQRQDIEDLTVTLDFFNQSGTLTSVDIEDVFVNPSEKIVFSATSSDTSIAQVTLKDNKIGIVKEDFNEGEIVVTLIASSGAEEVSTTFKVNFVRPELNKLADLTVNLLEKEEATLVDFSTIFDKPLVDVTFSVASSNTEIAQAIIKEDQIGITNQNKVEGAAIITLTLTSGVNTLTVPFTITYSNELLRQNDPNSDSLDLIDSFEEEGTDFFVIAADDFTIPEGETWSIERLRGIGDSRDEDQPWSGVAVIYSDDNGEPGAEIYRSEPIMTTKDRDEEFYNMLNIELPEAINLSSGAYWISLYTISEIDRANSWTWIEQDFTNGHEAVIMETGVPFLPISEVFGDPEFKFDLKFQLFGTFVEANPTGNKTTTANKQLLATIYPNPSLEYFVLDFSTLPIKEEVTLVVTNISGKTVLQKSGIHTSLPYRVDTSGFAPGFYVVTIKGATQSKSFKVIKK